MIIHGLSNQGLKCSFLARGALKSKKRFAGGILDPLQYVEVLATKSNKRDSLMSLDEANLIDGFDKLRTDFENLEAAFWATDIVQKVTQEEDPHNKAIFDLLGNGLKALTQGLTPEVFRIQFGLKILLNQGVLQTATWMNPFLSSSLMGSNLEEVSSASIEDAEDKISWIEFQIKQYLTRAEL